MITAHPFLLSVSFGAIEPYVAPLHDAGILVASQVHDATEAVTTWSWFKVVRLTASRARFRP